MSCSDVDKKTFNKAWASFVDVSTGFDAIGTSYAVTSMFRSGLGYTN